MFSPDPLKTNAYVEAAVEFRSGATGTWSFPRMERLGLGERYCKERYRKFENDWLWRDMHSQLWPDAARYIARESNNAWDPPRTVKLIRYSANIPPPGSRTAKSHWNKDVFFTYEVKEGDLR